MFRSSTGAKLVSLIIAAALATAACGGGGAEKTPIKIGGLATLEGPFAVPGQDGMRGIEQALNKYAPKNADGNWEIAGREIILIKESSDGAPAVALEKAKKLIEQDDVDILIGPLSGDEGLAIKDYAKTVPDKTFVNGSSAAQDTTFRDPAPNFFRFSTDGAQWMAGVGKYAYEVKGYKTAAVVAEDYSFPYTQVGGFMYEFCAVGGKVPFKAWVPLGTKDYASVVTSLPTDVDAIYVALGGADAVNFFTQYAASGGTAKFIGGSITVDQSVLSVEGDFKDQLVGTIAGGPTADTTDEPAWNEYVKVYRETFPDGLPFPGLFALSYYNETVGVLEALKAVEGDLGGDQKKFMEALAKVSFDGPTGKVSLDANRQAISANYVTEVQKDADGNLVNNVIAKAENIDQTLGLGADSPFLAQPVSRDFPACP
jgi:branched-chain amino acid transport system substrate-binding protein